MDDDDDIDFYMLSKYLVEQEKHQHSRCPPIFRKRWDSRYLIELAHNESSFVAEYRLDIRGFRDLSELLLPRLLTNRKMSLVQCGK
jgi:hypothetical protein